MNEKQGSHDPTTTANYRNYSSHLEFVVYSESGESVSIPGQTACFDFTSQKPVEVPFSEPGVITESVRIDGEDKLLIVSPSADLKIFWNGVIAPVLVFARPGDTIRINEGPFYEVGVKTD